MGVALRAARAALERDLIRHALEVTHGKRGPAARLLGISMRSLYYKLAQQRQTNLLAPAGDQVT
jgi:DNA-binding NtrC family response regulator